MNAPSFGQWIPQGDPFRDETRKNRTYQIVSCSCGRTTKPVPLTNLTQGLSRRCDKCRLERTKHKFRNQLGWKP
jgi:hypothetical protein